MKCFATGWTQKRTQDCLLLAWKCRLDESIVCWAVMVCWVTVAGWVKRWASWDWTIDTDVGSCANRTMPSCVNSLSPTKPPTHTHTHARTHTSDCANTCSTFSAILLHSSYYSYHQTYFMQRIMQHKKTVPINTCTHKILKNKSKTVKLHSAHSSANSMATLVPTDPWFKTQKV